MHLLLVEDDQLLGDGIKAGLTERGYVVDWVKDGHSASLALETEPFDLLILDLTLPRRSGLDVLSALRQSDNKKMPVLILTARDTVPDRVQGLDAGADDYVVKPFDLDELDARIRALLRRSMGRAAPVLHHGELELDPAAHTVRFCGNAVNLSRREFAILQRLLEERGRVLSQGQLEQHLYAWGEEVESNAIQVHVHHLRKKLRSDLITTIRGVGYIIKKSYV